MSVNPYLRLFGALAAIPTAALLIGVLFGRRTATFLTPALVAAFFGGLVIIALTSGSVWFAERGGSGAYKIGRKKEPFWYWLTVTLYAVFCAAFASFYISR
jgi:hypothetical protein